ncbi:lipocalin-like domain-containing protein [Atopococcus tabaci]|uniref:lipocalin-like domain-containing protein n=1 Tax=Atopococcus tabaci TaxID=269774 RepID=UPI0004276D24|nr:lipocalin-like domain-containing protein [Atopococcus tabaci]
MGQSFREKVIGTWTLLEYSRENKDGERFYPLGKDATGFLMYTPDGYMSAQLMAQAAHAYHAYSGRFEVDEENQTLYHHMEVSMIPNRLGQVQDRIIQMDGDRITITSNATSSYIVWKRAEDNSDNLR